MAAYVSIVGLALGNIIAIIITAHIINVNHRLAKPGGSTENRREPIVPRSAGSIGILMRYNHDSPLIATSAANRVRRSRNGNRGVSAAFPGNTDDAASQVMCVNQ